MRVDESLDRLPAEAEARPPSGWDFSWLGDRVAISPLPWDFEEIVLGHARRAPDMLWYLNAIPWAVDDFSISAHRPQLERLHARIQSDGPIAIRQPAFWLEAMKDRYEL